MVSLPEFVSRAVEYVGAPLGDVIHDTAHVAAIFGVEVGHDLQFCDGVWIAKKERGAAYRIVIVILAVQLKVIRTSALAVNGESRAIGIFKAAAAHRSHTGCKQDERIIGIPKRHIGDFLSRKSL